MKKVLCVISAALMLISCKKALITVFVNGTSDSVVVALYGENEKRPETQFNIGPNGVRKSRVLGAYAQVSWPSGRPGYKTELSRNLGPFMKYVTEHMMIYILVTTEGMHPIPPEFREDWQGHLSEITNNTSLLPQSQTLRP